VSGSGISLAICKSAPCSRQITTQFFTGQMPFLTPNQQCQSTEGINTKPKWSKLTQKHTKYQLNLYLQKDTNQTSKNTRKLISPKLNINLRTAHICVHIAVHNCRTQHTTQQFWQYSTSTLQTTTIAQMLSVGGDGAVAVWNCRYATERRLFL